MCIVPFTCPGGIPCEVPGANPTSPLITTGPVLLIEAVAMTAKLPAEPSLMVAGPAEPLATPVVKLHGSGGVESGPLVSALPDRSLTRLETVAVYWVFAVRLADGTNVAIWLAESYDTVPLTGAPPTPVTASVKVALVIVVGSIAVLKV